MAEQYKSYYTYSDESFEYDGDPQPVKYNTTRFYNDPSLLYSGGVNSFTYNNPTLTYSDPTIFYSGGFNPYPLATGSGVGSGTATGVRVQARTATGSGVSTETTVSFTKRFRTATGSGEGTQTGVGVRVAQRTATGFGSSGESALWTKSLIFRPPVEDKFPWADYREQTPDHALFGYVRQGNRARNVYLLKDGTFTNVDPLDPAKVDKTYLGGHEWFVTPEEKAVLIAAGYTVT